MTNKKTTYYSYGNVFKSTAEVYYPTSVKEIQAILKECKQHNRKITLAGSFNSFDRQNSGNDVVVSLKHFDKIVFNKNNHTITVGGGAKWGAIIEEIYNNKCVAFTCITGTQPSAAGTLSVNANSMWTPANGKAGNHCLSFQLLTTEGLLLTCSRTENSDLFYGVIGGLGGLGFIIEITYQVFYVGSDYQIKVKVTDYDNIDSIEERLYLRKSTEYKKLEDLGSQSTLFYLDKGQPKFCVYTRYYEPVEKKIPNKKLVFYAGVLASGLIRFVPSLANTVVKNDVGKTPEKRRLLQGLNAIKNGTFWAEPDYYWAKYFGKALFWMGYKAKLYQNSYFIPTGGEKVTVFTKKIMELIEQENLQFFMFDVLYVPKDEPFILSASKNTDGFYVNTTFMDGINKDALMRVYAELNQLTLEMGGKMNLAKNCFVKPELMEKMHQVEIEEFVQLKKKYDPTNLLTSSFFETHFPSYFSAAK